LINGVYYTYINLGYGMYALPAGKYIHEAAAHPIISFMAPPQYCG